MRAPQLFDAYDRDYDDFRTHVDWIIDALSQRPGAWKGEVLIHGLHGFVPSFKEEFVYGAVLAWHGYRPVFLVERTDVIERYVTCLPGVRIVDWHAFAPEATSAERSAARRLLAGIVTVRALVNLDVDGCAVGRHALSRFMQERHLGSIAIDRMRDALVQPVAASLAAWRASRACLDQEAAKVVLMNERGYTPLGEFFDACLARGRRVVQYVSSHRDDARVYTAYTMATRTEHPYSLSPETWAEALQAPFGRLQQETLLARWESFYRDRTWFNFQRLQHLTRLQDSNTITSRLGLDPNRKTAVIYAHIFWDATFFYGESLYEDYKEWFVDTVRTANANDHVNWIIKLHPVNVWRRERKADGEHRAQYAEIVALEEAGIRLGKHIKVLMPETDISSWSLFHATDYCLTVRGTVGIENAALGKRVVVAGSGHYSARGFTTNPDSVETYRRLVASIETIKPPSDEERERALRYGYWLLQRKPYSLGNYRMHYDSRAGVQQALNGSLQILAVDLAGFFQADAVTRWVAWLVSSQDLDCLASDPLPSQIPSDTAH